MSCISANGVRLCGIYSPSQTGKASGFKYLCRTDRVDYSLGFINGSASVSSVVWCFAKLACFPISFCFPLEQPRLLPSPFPHVKRGEVEGESISFNARFPHISSTRFLEARFPSMKTSLFFLSSGCLVFLGQAFPFSL